MLKNLFVSQVRIDLLSIFLMHPGEEYYLRELVTKLSGSPRPVSLELNNLEKIGLITKRVSGQQHYFSVNQQHTIYKELRDMFIKTVGIRDIFAEQLEVFHNSIDYAFLYGSAAKGAFRPDSDIDVLIIGAIASRQLASALAGIGAKTGREVNYAVFPLLEIEKRLEKQDHFIISLLKEPMVFIMGDEDEFRRLAQKRLVEAAPHQP